MKARAASAALALLLPLACAQGPRAEQPRRIALKPTQYLVTATVERGAYLDAVLHRPDSTIRLFFPASDACRRLIRVESVVGYKAESLPGILENAEGSCDAVGIGSLATWRDRVPRERFSRDPVPRGTATFQVVYEDADLVLVRGRFPLASQIGWAGGWDTVAALPRSAACRSLVERGAATLEFRPAGPDPYRLVARDGYCTIEAFLKPLPTGGAKPGSAAGT